jgi:hypothetical protein
MGWRDEKDLLVKQNALLRAENIRLKERIDSMIKMIRDLEEKATCTSELQG